MERSAGEIPEDVRFEILIRLPVKSLCKFRSVSASWLSAISDPYFIRSHHARSKSTSTKFLVSFSRSGWFGSWDLFTCDASDPSEPVALAWKVSNCASGVPPSRSVRGLICFPTEDYDICILNPSTRECISIPRTQPTESNSHFCYFCFGFDPVANQHKVIYSFGEGHDIWDDLRKETECWVFTLGRAEKWRRIGVLDSNYHTKSTFFGEVCIDGLIYFVVHRQESGNPDYYGLVQFDLHILGPHQFHDISHRCTLFELNGLVALVDNGLFECFSSPQTGYPPRINVWVLEDFHKQIWDLKRSVLTPDSWSGRMPAYLGGALHGGGDLLVFMPIRVWDSPSVDLFFFNVDGNNFWRKTVDLPVPVGIAFDRGIHSYCLICSDHIESSLSLKGSSCISDRHKGSRSSDAAVSTSTR